MPYDIHKILKKYWGYDDFRELQQDIIESVLSGHDTLGLMPTGGGKSITFQIPALALGGLTIVVTPLIALMKDQVDNLRARGIRAAYLHSGLTYPQMKAEWDKIINSDCRFLYVSPERIAGDHFLEQIRLLHKVTLVAVDEAHCISQWGYDFRPAYLNIVRLRKILPESVPFMALTASATPAVADDICRCLQFKRGQVFRKSFARPNISYVVRYTDDKIGQILKILTAVPGTSIVYVRSRRRTREIAELLCDYGINAMPFHAGMEPEEKVKNQQLWKDGKVRVIVATNAFGMGIDKPDVRTVIHFTLPSSLEEYYQEAGRAGRDGLPSFAVALVGPVDKSVLRRRIAETFPDREVILNIYELVCNFIGVSLECGYNRVYAFDLDKFCDIFGLQQQQVVNSLKILTYSGYLEFLEALDSSPRVMFTCDKEDLYGIDYLHLPKADVVINHLLRNYAGLFTEYAYIDDYKMALATGLSQKEIYDTLIALAKAKILSFIPRRTTPCIFMTTSREELQFIRIPKTVYEDRKAALEARIESIIAYVDNDGGCRACKLLRYFGEENLVSCGKCDCCRDEARTCAKRISKKELVDKLLNYISAFSRGVALDKLYFDFRSEKDRLPDIMDGLIDEGYLSCADGVVTISQD